MTPEHENALRESIAMGEEAARALDCPPVQAYFETSESRLLDALLGAPAGDEGHAAREGLTAQLRAIRKLREALETAVESARYAVDQLTTHADETEG